MRGLSSAAPADKALGKSSEETSQVRDRSLRVWTGSRALVQLSSSHFYFCPAVGSDLLQPGLGVLILTVPQPLLDFVTLASPVPF